MSSTFYLKQTRTVGTKVEEDFPQDCPALFPNPIRNNGNQSWDDLTKFAKNQFFIHIWGNSKKILFSALVQLDHISKGVQFATSTTAVELNEWEDDWKLYETRVLCLALSNPNTAAHPLYTLEFISQETGSICNLEVQPDFKFSTVDNQFIIYNKKVKEKTKKLAFSTKTKSKLLEFVDTLNPILVTMNEANQPRKLSDTPLNLSAGPSTPVPSSPQPTDFPDFNSGTHEPLTAKRILDIILNYFQRKEKEDKKKRLQKADISAPTDFRHVQHVGMDHNTLDSNRNTLINERLSFLELPTTSDPNQINGAAGYTSHPTSPAQDKRTISFIYDVIEECRDSSTKLLASETVNARQTIHFPLLPSNAEMSSLLDTKEPSNKSQASNDRARLINELRIHLQDEDTRKLIFDFIETYKKDVNSVKTENMAVQTEQIDKPVQSMWSRGRLSTPPPPTPQLPSNNISNKCNENAGIRLDPSMHPKDFKNPLTAELHENFVSRQNGLGRSNTWSKDTREYSTLPSAKPPIKLNPIKKTYSDIRKRPTAPPPPPLVQINKPLEYIHNDLTLNPVTNVTVNDDQNNEGLVTPSSKVEVAPENAAKKLPPPIPKPRMSKAPPPSRPPVRRMNSTPSVSNDEHKLVGPSPIQSSKSFDTESGTGITPQVQFVSELKSKIENSTK